MIRERPILFSGPMVRAILEGRKTQTRRLAKYVPALGEPSQWCPSAAAGEPLFARYVGDYRRFCPYGEPGGRLWVRERQRVIEVNDARRATGADYVRVRYEADGAESGWLPDPHRLKGTPIEGRCLAYGGYRESSRLTLDVVDVRVERLQSISEEDARAEGIAFVGGGGSRFGVMGLPDSWGESAAGAFACLWDSINGKRASWASNPWVWVVTFGRAEVSP